MTSGTRQPRSSGAAAGGRPEPFRYDGRLASEIEARWQRRWADDGTFRTPNPCGPLSDGFGLFAGRPRRYVLDMFPYPSGATLHVGHVLGYVATDVYARYLRMTGHHVLHAFGYDTFGLPAEQYAISTGQHPEETTAQNVETMRGQLRRLGLGHNPRREVRTSDPSFYRWTQWMFLRIWDSWVDEATGRARPIGELVAEFRSGRRQVPGGRDWAGLAPAEQRRLLDGFRLAYRADELVNWCPALGTVLANEEVTADGRSEVGNHPVYRRPLRQWLIRITALADRLLADLDLLDWPEPVKQMQRNWIARSQGARIAFRPGRSRSAHESGDTPVEVFTTRPDTLPGATFLALAPEHPLGGRLTARRWPAGTPLAWRYPQGQDPQGPGRGGLGGRRPGGGTAGWTPARAVAAYREAAARRSDRQREAAAAPKSGVFTGSYVINPATGAPIPVFLADFVLPGYGTGASMGVPGHDARDAAFAAALGVPARPGSSAPAGWPDPDGSQAAVQAAAAWLQRAGAGRPAVSYRLRDWLFSRQRYWGEPIPIVYDSDGLARGLPDHALPVRLPRLADFRPRPATEHGEPLPPLARARDWTDVEVDLGDGPQPCRRELSTMPQWAGSCWYFLRYLDPANDRAPVDPDVERYWMADPAHPGVDLYIGGAEHATGHLLYARFWHKVLFDLGHVSAPEPFRRLVNQGDVLADAFTDARGFYVPAAEVEPDGAGGFRYRGQPVTRRPGRMGKSKRNGVSPDDICARYGADTLRLYELAMGPLAAARPWQTRDIAGMHRFLARLWRSVIDEQTGSARVGDEPLAPDTRRALHATIAAVRADLGSLRFNTAIARLIELTGHAAKISGQNGSLPRPLAERLVLMVAPLAPHVAEELWSRLGHPASLAYEPFPQADPASAAAPTVTVPVQVNGRTRLRIEVPASAGRQEVARLLEADPRFRGLLAGRTVRRLIVVPGRIVNALTGGEAPGPGRPGRAAQSGGAPGPQLDDSGTP